MMEGLVPLGTLFSLSDVSCRMVRMRRRWMAANDCDLVCIRVSRIVSSRASRPSS